MHKKSQRFLILGASRGLGWATYSFLNQKYSDAEFLLVSRKIQNNLVTENTQKIAQDFSKTPIDQEFLKQLIEFDPTVIIYSAGGGPYGPFETKKWSDHQWALNVNFIYPAQLIHEILNKNNQFQHLKSMTLVGSDVAENKPDQNAASYSAAKHALRGLVTTVQIENTTTVKFKLFSPSYIDTPMLPMNSIPRIQNLAEDPSLIAEKLIDFINSDHLIWSASTNR